MFYFHSSRIPFCVLHESWMSYMCYAFNGQNKRKASFSSSKTYFQLRNHWVQRPLSLTYLQVDRLLVAMYDLENRYCVKQKLVSKNENEKKKKRKNFAKRIRKLFQKQYWLLYLKLQFIWCYYKRNTVFSTSFVCITKDWVLFHQMLSTKTSSSFNFKERKKTNVNLSACKKRLP